MRKDVPDEIKLYGFQDKHGYMSGYLYCKIGLTSEGNFLYLAGHLMTISSWSLDNIPLESEFMASVYFKWDGCTHWSFFGEDYQQGSDADSYYHLCGSDLPRFITFMGLVAHIAKSQPNATRNNNLSEIEILETEKLLEQYDIIEFSGVPCWVEDKVLEYKF